MLVEVCFLALVYPIIELMFCANCHEDIKESTDRCPACGSEKIVNNGMRSKGLSVRSTAVCALGRIGRAML